MVKKILILAVNENWTGISRLPQGLTRSGFEVYALCPKKSFLAKTKFLKDSILYPTFTYSRSKLIYLWMSYAILKFDPEFIIPGDEDTILALHNLAAIFEKIPFLKKYSTLIRTSTTPKVHDDLVLNKSKFQKLCAQLGLRTPKNIVVTNVKEAILAATETGYPLVIKHDSGYGGSGVFICHNQAEVEKHFSEIKKESLVNILKTKIKSLFFVSIFNIDNQISIQQFIAGEVGQSPFCSKDGNVFAFNPMKRLHTYPGTTGPASVSAGIENPDIEHFVRTIAKALHYSGFGSVEYMLEKSSGLLYIIELNPRPTPTCHIEDTHVTNDLCRALYLGLNQQTIKLNPFKAYTVAMFPGEKKRDPNSKFLTDSYHDIPVNDPELLKALDPK